ncbi:MAG: polysaccharide biosynthesis tyrosine autokinase [Sulfuricurvum sp.]
MSSYLNNAQQGHTGGSNEFEEEIDLKEVVVGLFLYKKSMATIVFITFLISVFVAYSKTDIYQAELTLQTQDSPSSRGQNDFLTAAIGLPSGNLANEIAVLKSRFIAQKVLERVQLGTRYYIPSGLKTTELYKNIPFKVHTEMISESLLGYSFELRPIDEQHFLLRLSPKFGMKLAAFFGSRSAQAMVNTTDYQELCLYGKKINNSLFRLTITKEGALTSRDYTFTIVPNDTMAGMIQSSIGVAMGADQGSILSLSYQDNVPERAQDILNIVAEVYESQSVKSKSASAEKTLGFIDAQLEEIKAKLQQSEIKLKDYKSSHEVTNQSRKASIMEQEISSYETQLYELKMQESSLQTLLQYLKNNKEIRGLDLSTASKSISNLIQKIQDINTLRSSLLVDYTPKHPSVMKANEQLASLKADLQGTIESSLRGIQEREFSLNSILQKYTESLEAIPEEERELAQLNRTFNVNEKIYEYLLQKRAETSIIESSTVSGIRIVDEALVGGAPVQPNRTLIMMMGLIVGVLIGFLQAFVRHFIANTIQTINDVEGHTPLPLYGILPLFAERKSLYEDALRVLLTRLEFSDEKPQVITITSSVQKEGRTTTALELAQIISKSSKKVVILDLNMRESRVKRKLALSNELGISDILSGGKTFDEVVRHVTPYMDVVVAGTITNNPYELIISDQLNILLQQLRQEYRYIIIESPPAGLVADALVLMRLSDLNLIVFKAGYSKKDFIKSTNRFVKEHGLHNVGIILNALELKKIRPWVIE